jgi:hypothetical protein
MRSHQPHGPVGPSSSPGSETEVRTWTSDETVFPFVARESRRGTSSDSEPASLARLSSDEFSRSLYDYVKS